MGTGSRGRNPMLTSAGFGDHTLLAHAEREERLADRVVDFVRTGVIEVFTLEPDLRATTLLRESLGKIEWRWAADIVLQERRKLGLKRGILTSLIVFNRQLIECANKSFGNVTPTKLAEAAGIVGYLCRCGAISHCIDF